MSTTRTFIALNIDPGVLRRAMGVCERLRHLAPRARWVDAEQAHLTLLFLGELSDSEVAEACACVEWTAEAWQPFAVRVRRVGAFPSIERPKAIWLGAETESDELERLHQDLLADLGHLQQSRERNRFVPHLTLARLGKQGTATPQLGGALANLAEHDAGSFVAEELTVYASELHPQGPDYYPLARGRLGGK